MSLSDIVRPALVLLISLALLSPHAVRVQAQGPSPQILFTGDRDCGDTYGVCRIPHIAPLSRYLHLIIHGWGGDTYWRVQASADCLRSPVDLGGAEPLPGEYGEVVLDLSAAVAGNATSDGETCLLLRGSHGYGAKYYAAYLDTSSAPDAATLFPGYPSMNGRPYLPDLDVEFIHRSPSYAYDATPNQPTIGSEVTYTAHIANQGATPLPSFSYTWSLDGRRVAGGVVSTPIPRDGATSVSYAMRWDGLAHTLTFNAGSPASEISTGNDRLSIRTDAITLGFWVERSASQYFDNDQWPYCRLYACAGSDSLADWLQRTIAAWNRMFARDRYLAWAPAGITTRVRLDELTVVPDRSLPLNGALPTNDPDVSDHTVDLEWGLPSAGTAATYTLNRDGIFDIDYPMLHELSHARSLTDMYRFDLTAGPDLSIDIRDDAGHPIYDPADPFNPSAKLRAVQSDIPGTFIYRNAERDFMSCPCTGFYSAYDAVVLNRLSNRRARCGNTNPPCNLGDWFGDVPVVSRLRILDRRGKPVPNGAALHLYFDSGATYSGHVFRSSDSATLPIRHGLVTLPPDPFHAQGSPNVAAHNDLILEVTTPSDDVFCVLEPSVFNLAYWSGYSAPDSPATFTLRLGRQIDNGCNLGLPPPIINAPFSTSASASAFSLTPDSSDTSRIVVRLVDDAPHPDGMANRIVRIYVGSRLAGSVTTNPGGIASLHLGFRPAASSVHVFDVTDNDLEVLRQKAGQLAPADRSP